MRRGTKGALTCATLALATVCLMVSVSPAFAAPASPPSITKAFGASSIPLGHKVSLSFGITNPNQLVSLTGIGFADTLPSGLSVATPNGLSGSCGGGTITAVPGSSGVGLSSATLAAAGHCSFSVQLISTTGGAKDNSVTVTSDAGTGNTSVASVTVIPGPLIATNLLVGGNGVLWFPKGTTATMAFELVNPNTNISLTGVGFTDTLPAGLVIAQPNGLTGSCQGGTLTATAGTQVISLVGASFTPGPTDPGSYCDFSVTVKGASNGFWTNDTGPVAFTEGGQQGSAPGITEDVAVIAPGPRLYWDNDNASSIEFAKLDGSVGSTFGGFLCTPLGLTIDAAADRLYWNNTTCTGRISFRTFDGTSSGTLNTSGASPAEGGVAVDPPVGRIFWDSDAATGIGSAKLDGSGGSNLSTTGATVGGGRGLVVDPGTGRVYWANIATDSISYAAIDGSGGADLTITGTTPDGINGLAIDPGTGRIYWANGAGNTIAYANLDGTNGGILNTTGAPLDQPHGVAIDPVAGRIYWTNVQANSVGYANLDGSGGGGTFSAPGTSSSTPYYVSILYPPGAKKAPAITGGSSTGSTLSCSKGTWAKDVLGDFFYRAPHVFAYSWTRNGVAINGATSKTLLASATGDYRCTVTAANGAGSKAQTSAKHTVT